MPNKCCVARCKGNYDSQEEKVKAFKFPPDATEREKWRKSLPNVIDVRHLL